MKFELRIKKDGTLITEVMDRANTVCSSIKQVTNALGREISDEHIGPECDDVRETVGGSEGGGFGL